MSAELPYVDEHVTVIDADVDEVWPTLVDAIDRGFSRPGMTALTRALGCADCTVSGPRPLAEGATVPGFRVVAAVPGAELALVGRHRFSSYALTFRLERAGGGRSRLSAESRAAFPGLSGRAYRQLVIGSGGHVLAVRRLLSGIKRHQLRT